jgi:hypothetical protein
MSDELIREIQRDIEKEKALLFFKKYGLYIALLIVAVLGYVVFSQMQKNKHHDALQSQANLLANTLIKIKENPDANINLDSLTEPYKSLAVGNRYQEILKQKNSTIAASKIATDYIETAQSYPKNQPNYTDLILSINLLTAQSNNLSLDAFEEKVKDYVKKPSAFTAVAYEFMVTKSIQDNNYQKANIYMDLLKEQPLTPSSQKRYKIYTDIIDNHIPKTVKNIASVPDKK